jgi:predicted metalloendopeptidase
MSRLKLKLNNSSDYDEYVNSSWYRDTKIPDDQNSWNTFNILHEQNVDKIKNILEQYAKTPEHKYHVLGKFYMICLSSNDRTNNDVLIKIKHYLDVVDRVSNKDELGHIIGLLTKLGIDTFFRTSVSEDSKNTSILKLILSYVGLSMPEKKYYTDEKFNNCVIEFKKLINQLFQYIGYDTNISNDIFIIEKHLITLMKPSAERRNMDKLYHKISLTEFINSLDLPNMWKNFFISANLDHVGDLITYDFNYFKEIAKFINNTSLQITKNYIKYLIIKDFGKYLITDIDNILFDFFEKQLLGQPINISKPKRIIEFMSSFTSLGEILGREYIDKYCDTGSFNIVKQIIQSIHDEMGFALINCTWMSDETKDKALKKLKSFKAKVGHPDVWRNFDEMISKLNRTNNIINMSILFRYYNYDINVLSQINKPSDPNKWSMNVYDINAYYDQHRNEIVFPAGILQEPFFSLKQSLFENYGGIGTVIGHEIIHGYDDQGRKYDENGNTVNWWTPDDLSKFNMISDKMKLQYSKYSVNDHNVDGALTLGENLADLGGIILAMRAVIRLSDNNIDGLDAFFRSYANLWKKITRPEKILAQLLSDPHSPGKYRIYNLRNVDEFYQVYEIDKNNKMYLDPIDRIRFI